MATGGQSLAAALLGPDMPEPGVPGFMGSVRTHLQRFVVRDLDHQEAGSDRFGMGRAIVLNVGDIGVTVH